MLHVSVGKSKKHDDFSFISFFFVLLHLKSKKIRNLKQYYSITLCISHFGVNCLPVTKKMIL